MFCIFMNSFINMLAKELFIIKLSMESKWVAIVREQFREETGKLSLYWKAINDSGIPEIIEACQGVQNKIKELDLRSNNIGDKGAKYLSAANFPNLTELWLGSNKIGAEGAKQLSAANFPNLKVLYLYNNRVGAEGAKYLSAANFPNLKGAKYLSAANFPNLKVLYLFYNNIQYPHNTYLKLLFEQKNIENVNL